jgi:plastocyanin
MPRRTPFALLALAILLSLGFALAAKAKDDDAKNVTIKDLKFNPAKLTIKPGETVVWTNKDDKDHTVVSDDRDEKTGFKSDNLSSGDTFKHTFDKKGKFGYSCSYHPRMKGTIIVAD